MGDLSKITVQVPTEDLERAQEFTGAGVTETVRAGLKQLASMQAQQRLLKLRGAVKFSTRLDELRRDRR